jgi:DNA repair exonuclease SbcCD nuclease subunit
MWTKPLRMPVRSGRPTVRLLHTSDVHISTVGPALWALAAVVDMALESGVDLVLIAGDLFDSARVPQEVAEAVVADLARLTVPTIVIPGNHDCIDQLSIYRRVDLTKAGDHVFFANDPGGRRLVLEELRLSVWARGIEDHKPSNRPLLGYEPSGPRYWEVVVAHGHYVGREEASDRSSPITAEEIGRLSCDYLALGHWHRFLDVSEGETTAFYSGSPSDAGADGPTVNVVTLDPDSGVQVERRRIVIEAPTSPG